MSWGFERGRLYNRRKDIHGQFGGQQQGGIITPAKHPLIVIVTGEEGLQHGYSDKYRPDGIFEYFGEGQVGDMELLRGNRAIAEHSVDGKSLLLFRKEREGYRFVDEMICESFHESPAPDREGNIRQAIVFELMPLSAVETYLDNKTPVDDVDLETLRKWAFQSAAIPAQQITSTRNIYARSRDVRDYVVARAKGNCEGCKLPAPFIRRDGSPYLEPHHIRRVSDGGPDDPRFVIALCPNCHRRVHFGKEGEEYNQILLAMMSSIEAQ